METKSEVPYNSAYAPRNLDDCISFFCEKIKTIEDIANNFNRDITLRSKVKNYIHYRRSIKNNSAYIPLFSVFLTYKYFNEEFMDFAQNTKLDDYSIFGLLGISLLQSIAQYINGWRRSRKLKKELVTADPRFKNIAKNTWALKRLEKLVTN